MECTLATLFACLSLSNVYVDAQMSWQDAFMERVDTTTREVHFVGPLQPTEPTRETNFVSVSHDASNPYLRNAIGYELRFRSFDIALEAFHDSSMSSNKDRGVNGVAIRARWFPFRR